MGAVWANLSEDFLFPKLHARWAAALAGEVLENLLRGNSMQLLARAVSGRGVEVRQRTEVQRQLTCHLITELSSIRRLLDDQTAAFYSQFMARFYVDNLKTILHRRYFPANDTDLSVLLVEHAELPGLPAELLVGAKSVHEFYRLLPMTPLKQDILLILVELDSTKDMLVAGARFDALHYRELLRTARCLPGSLRQLAVNLVITEIDISNIVILLRNQAIYQLPAAAVADLLIGEGFIAAHKSLSMLTGAERPADITALLPPKYRRLLTPLLGEPTYVGENALWNLLFGSAHQAFSDYNRPVWSVAAFPFLKWFESLNIARLFEGLYLGLDSKQIRSMMIGV